MSDTANEKLNKSADQANQEVQYMAVALFQASSYTKMLDDRDALKRRLAGSWVYTKDMAIADLDNISVSYDGERVQSSNISNPTERIAMKINDERYMARKQAELDAEKAACASELEYLEWKIEVVETTWNERLTRKQHDVFTLIFVGHKTYQETEKILWKKRKWKLVDRNIAAIKQAILEAIVRELQFRRNCTNEGEYVLKLLKEGGQGGSQV